MYSSNEHNNNIFIGGIDMENNILKVFESDGIKLGLIKDNYCSNECVYFGLMVAEDNEEEDVYYGEMWSDVTINIDGLRENEIAINRDFEEFSSKELVDEVIEFLIKGDIDEYGFIPSGFCFYRVYELSPQFL